MPALKMHITTSLQHQPGTSTAGFDDSIIDSGLKQPFSSQDLCMGWVNTFGCNRELLHQGTAHHSFFLGPLECIA
ncbi:hypothetical protein [Synechococcus sp. MIT S1220]|uniref:hypothetical protein n=1 Tax=Synechococcus sp. MIT S1220 TaxID=3082549 RepID=UPI0039B09D43